MNGKIEQALHEKLCAYVLGELEGAERAEMEREILRSADLRAEKERLEATIGAVRGALGEGETLPWAAHRDLEQAARPSRLARVPWLQLAAGIGAVGLGWWIFARESERTTPARFDQVARFEGGVEQQAYDGNRREFAPAKADAAVAGGDLGARGKNERAAGAAPALEIVDSLRSQAEAPAEPAAAAGVAYEVERTPQPKDEKAELLTMSRDAAGDPTGVHLRARLAQENPPVSVGYVAVDPSLPTTTTAVTPGQATGISGRFSASYGGRAVAKGRPAGPPPAASTPAPSSPGPAGPASGGTYKGAGDTVPAREALPAVESRVAVADGKKLKDSGQDFFAELGYAGDDADGEQDLRRRWRHLPPAEQERYLDLRCGTILRDCTRRPSERPRDMFFRFWGDNPFEVAVLDRLSTFSVDVDTASYALARRYLNEGNVPEKAQIRTEEFVNYFDSDIPAPVTGTFAVHTDLTPSRFSADAARQMLRVVVRARDVQKLERDAMHLTFVVDVSGSMRQQNRLETVKHALRLLVAQLEPRDSIAIVKFSTDASIVLPMTPVIDRAAIEAAIAPMSPGGSTNSNAGLQLGYAQALSGLNSQAVNRVVFLSDGVANVGETDAQAILEGVRSIREKGIFLNTIGVGMSNHNDVLLEQLANKGDGVCNYVDSNDEVKRALVDRFTGAFQPVARDVKIQVEFDPEQVLRYRLLGYENRAIADADFRNDKVDAGELGAGHQVTALYELELTGRKGDGPLATTRLRWKPIRAAGTTAEEDAATEASFTAMASSYQAFESSPPGHRRAMIVAQFAEILRRSIHARGDSLDDLIREATLLQKQIPGDKEFAEFCALLLRSKELILRTIPSCDELCQAIDHLRNTHYLHATAEESGKDAQLLAEIERTTKELERRVRELLRRQLESEQR